MNINRRGVTSVSSNSTQTRDSKSASRAGQTLWSRFIVRIYYVWQALNGDLGGDEYERRKRRAAREFRRMYPNEDRREYLVEKTMFKLRLWAPFAKRCALALGLLIFLLFALDFSLARIERARVGSAVHEARAQFAVSDATFALYGNENVSSHVQTLHAINQKLSYMQIRGTEPTDDHSDVQRLMWHASAFLVAQLGVEACCCAPMFGVPIRHLALWNGEDKPIMHLFNVRSERYAEYDRRALIDDPSVSLSIVRQHLDHLFDWDGHDTVHPVQVLRINELLLDVTLSSGKHTQVTLKDRTAHCAALCLDLYEGVDVWTRAARQEEFSPAQTDDKVYVKNVCEKMGHCAMPVDE